MYFPAYSESFLSIASERDSSLDVCIELHGNANGGLEMLAGEPHSN